MPFGVGRSYGEKPEKVWKPMVVMSQTHADMCVVGVGDGFPTAKLTLLDGTKSAITDLHGEKYTVILLWKSNLVLAREQYQRLPHVRTCYP